MLVIWAISQSSAFATTALIAPTGNARPMRTSMRESVRKSPSRVGEVLSPAIECGVPENRRHFTFAITGLSARKSITSFVQAKHAEFPLNFPRDFATRSKDGANNYSLKIIGH